MDGAISSSMEDYLEAIAEIIEENEHAHTKDIAERLKVKMPSVSSALQTLAARGLIKYQSHAPVVLTPAGAQAAAVIRRRHQALKTFFAETLMIDPERADKAACRVEHVVGETIIARLVALAEAIDTRGDCAELRKYLAGAMPEICSDDCEDQVSLDQLGEGESAIVLHVAESLRGIKKFADLGLVRGTLLQMEGRAPFGDLLRVKVMGSSLLLRSGDAAYIWVKKRVSE